MIRSFFLTFRGRVPFQIHPQCPILDWGSFRRQYIDAGSPDNLPPELRCVAFVIEVNSDSFHSHNSSLIFLLQ
jgi:hypothetical protein